MPILALDLGKFKSMVCDSNARMGEHCFYSLRTVVGELGDLLKKVQPGRLVIKVSNQAIMGWRLRSGFGN